MRALRDEYWSLSAQDIHRNQEAAARIQTIIQPLESETGRNAELSRDDLRTVARLLVELYPPEQLEPRSQLIRGTIRELVGAEGLSGWFERQIDELPTQQPAQQRALLRELQRRRAAVTIDFQTAELFRAAVLKQSLWAALGCIAGCTAASALFAIGCRNELATFALVPAFGALGAWISVAARVRDAASSGLARHAELNESPTSSVWLSPVFGAIGASLLVGAIKTGLLGGSAMSDYLKDISFEQCASRSGLTAIIQYLSVLTGDAGRGVIFVYALSAMAAGWTERLVPDLLEWIGTRVRLK